MKVLTAIILTAFCITTIACTVGKGCPTSGKNVGAERILSGDAKTLKAVKKAGKFKA
jgi:hypothetical protein